MLLINPHLAWSGAQLCYEAHLVGRGIDFYGATLVGFPTPALGFSESLGWSHTVNTFDGADSYRLSVEDDGYRFDDEIRDFSPSVSIDEEGNFVVAWLLSDPGRDTRVLARAYDALGRPFEKPIQVSNTTFNRTPTVAMNPNGDFVVAWKHTFRRGGFGFVDGITMQQYAFPGVPIGLSAHPRMNLFTSLRPSIDLYVQSSYWC